MESTNEQHTPSIPPRWELGNGWFLMICTGGSYEVELIQGNQLLDAWEVACWGEIGGAPRDVIMAAEERLTDPDCWVHDGNNGPTRFQEAVGETDRIAFYRLPNWSLVGALATQPEAPDPNPECPMQHVLHPAHAGPNPVLLFGSLPPHLARLGHP